MKKVVIETIRHSKQRYPTVGDWKEGTDGISLEYPSGVPTLFIRVSKMSDWRYEALVAVHELVEALLCKHAGVSEAQVDAFDLSYVFDEPGNDPLCPYRQQHRFAENLERQLAHELQVDWFLYEKEVNGL